MKSRFLFLTLLFAVIATALNGQLVTVYTQDFGTGTSAPSGWTTSGTNAQFVTSSPSNTYSGFEAPPFLIQGISRLFAVNNV
ncbi:MAG: hypothetical protein U0T73_03610 [Chitinophagales bacterium]